MFIFSILFIFAQRKITNLGEDGKSLDVCPVISRATLDTVLRCALSYVDTGIQSTDRYENSIHKKNYFLNANRKSKKPYDRFLICLALHNERVIRTCGSGTNSVAKILKKLRTSKGDYCIKQ